MKFLMYSTSGEGAQILQKIHLEGNEVALFIKDKIYKTVFDGILPKTETPGSFVDKDTIIIFDISGNGDVADKYRKSGHYVYGASKFSDKLEHDRNFGFECMQKAGIKTPECKEFTSFKDGIKYVQESNKRLVFKPSGSMPCKLTYVSKNTEELIHYLSFVEKHYGTDIDSFVLQDFIEGCVVSSEIFCDGKKILSPFNHTVEVKKSMNNDLGASTGCSGNITWPVYTSDIIKNGVLKIQQQLLQEQFIGQIDLNAVVNENGVFGLEWTPRFGYDATPTYLPLLNCDFGEFFANIAKGQAPKVIDTEDAYEGALRVTIPPYPVEFQDGIDPEKFSPSKGVPILNWEKFQEKIYFYEVAQEESDSIVHSGGSGVICITLGCSHSLDKCMTDSYKIAEELCIPDKQYRTDLDKLLPKMVEEVEEYI